MKVPRGNRGAVTLVGPLPPPVGGIAWFLRDLCAAHPELFEEVLRLGGEPSDQAPGGVRVTRIPGSSGTSRGLALAFALGARPGRVLHFNFSGPAGLVALACAPKPQQTWLLTLHHGDLLDLWSGLAPPLRMLARQALRRVDGIGYISEQQYLFFRQLQIPPARLYRIRPYIPLPRGTGQAPAVVLEKRESFSTLLLASGYPLPSYRLDWIIDFLGTRPAGEVCVVLCIYGRGDMDLLRRLRAEAQRRRDLVLIENLGRDDFHAVMESCDVYARLTAIDSFGVAVAEAVDAGLAVVASDVCERYPGARLVAAHDRIGAFESLSEAITAGRRTPAPPAIDHGILDLYSGRARQSSS